MVKGTVALGWSGRVVGDTPGRTPLNLEAMVYVFYPIVNYDRSFDFTGSQVGVAPGPGLSCQRTSYKIPDETSGMLCGMVRSRAADGTLFRNNPTDAPHRVGQ